MLSYSLVLDSESRHSPIGIVGPIVICGETLMGVFVGIGFEMGCRENVILFMPSYNLALVYKNRY